MQAPGGAEVDAGASPGLQLLALRSGEQADFGDPAPRIPDKFLDQRAKVPEQALGDVGVDPRLVEPHLELGPRAEFDQQGQRIVGLLDAEQLGDAEIPDLVEHGEVRRIVLEHQDAVEQGGA
nr:hypothetical protein [Amycolatopsis sp. YIM 10]